MPEVEQSLAGIQFLTDMDGQRTAVLIDLTLYGELWEDIYDILIARQRTAEPRETLAEVRQFLIREGKLDA